MEFQRRDRKRNGEDFLREVIFELQIKNRQGLNVEKIEYNILNQEMLKLMRTYESHEPTRGKRRSLVWLKHEDVLGDMAGQGQVQGGSFVLPS